MTIFCVYNGPDGQRAKALSVNRVKPDLNGVLNTLEGKFQAPLCLGYIDPDSADCEEVRTQQQLAAILNDRSHMHDPNAGCTFQCWMRVEDHPGSALQKQAAFENSRTNNSNTQNSPVVDEHHAMVEENDYYSPDNKLYRSSPGRHPPSRPQSATATSRGAPISTPPPALTSATTTPTPVDRHHLNRHATISPAKLPQNSATKISQYALQRLQALEAEQARRDAKGNYYNNNNNVGPTPNRPATARSQGARSVMTTASCLSSQTVLITEDQLRETFDELDLEGTGFVTKAAMREWFDKNVDTMGVPGCDRKFEKMLATAKKRHELDYQEFSVVMLKIAQW